MYTKILVPLDGSQLAECVLPHLTGLGSQDSEVILLRVIEPLSIPYGRQISEITSIEQLQAFETRNRKEAEEYLKRISDRLSRTIPKVRFFVVNGKPAEMIIEFALRERVELLVIATHGRSGISRLVWGSTTDRVIRSVNVPVLIIRAPGCGTASRGDKD